MIDAFLCNWVVKSLVGRFKDSTYIVRITGLQRTKIVISVQPKPSNGLCREHSHDMHAEVLVVYNVSDNLRT